MAVLVIAGSGRGAGKTAVGCALIRALSQVKPEVRWLAVKVSAHAHGVEEDLWEELDCRSEKDSGRYLAAGARRGFLLIGVETSRVVELVSGVRGRVVECDAVLVESNRIAAESVAHPGEPAVSIAVLSGAEAEWKPSLLECAGRMEALVLTHGASIEGLPLEFRHKPVFELAGVQWSTPELFGFVQSRLLLANG